MRPLGVGIVGCGRAAEELHLPGLRAVNGLDAAALADVDERRLDRVGNRFEVRRRFGDYRELVNDPAIDIVAVCVPAGLHAEVGLAAIAAGKHVLVEKPLALTSGDAGRMVERARQTPRSCAVGFNLRFHRLVEEARRIVLSGVLGDIELVRTVTGSGFHYGRELPAWRYRRAEGGGALFETAVHHADLWRYLTGSEVESVYTETSSRLFEDQAASVTARLSCGALIAAGFSQRTADSNEIEVYGQSARLSFSLYRAGSLTVQPISDLGGGPRVRVKRLIEQVRAAPAVIRAARRGGDHRDSYPREWRRFLGSISGDGNPVATFEDGWRALQIVLAMIESADSRRPVLLEDTAGRAP
jgi:predicted dehydrogenase